MKKVALGALWFLFGAAILFQLACAAYAWRGSLETLPTEEKNESVRLAAIAGILFLALLEWLAWRLIRRLRGTDAK